MEEKTEQQKALDEHWERIGTDRQIDFENRARYMFERGYFFGEDLEALAKMMAWKLKDR